MSSHVVRIPTKRPGDPAVFPAFDKPDLGGMLVDLRLFPAGSSSTSHESLVFRRDVLERDGINPAILDAAERSSPPGWLLLTDEGWHTVAVKAKYDEPCGTCKGRRWLRDALKGNEYPCLDCQGTKETK